jgi:hypothetical protein
MTSRIPGCLRHIPPTSTCSRWLPWVWMTDPLLRAPWIQVPAQTAELQAIRSSCADVPATHSCKSMECRANIGRPRRASSN